MDLARVIIFTGDVRRMVDFYSSIFGLSMIGDFDDGWTELAAGGSSVGFHKVPLEVRGSADDGVKLVFGTSNVAEEKVRLEGLGIEMTKIFEYKDIRFCDGYDPDGRRFQISSRGR